MEPLCPGRIFWAIYPGDRGDGKRRPMVVVTRRTDILRTGDVFAVVCSTDFDEPLRHDEVRLPSHPDRPCVTRLRQDTVAVCNWTATFRAEDIQKDASGLVPAQQLKLNCGKLGIIFPGER